MTRTGDVPCTGGGRSTVSKTRSAAAGEDSVHEVAGKVTGWSTEQVVLTIMNGWRWRERGRGRTVVVDATDLLGSPGVVDASSHTSVAHVRGFDGDLAI